MSRFSLFRVRFFILFVVLLSLLPLLGWAIYSNYLQREVMVAHIEEEMLTMARLASADQDRLVEGARQLLHALSQLPVVRRPDPLACNALLGELTRQNPAYLNLGVAGADGNIFCSGLPFAPPVSAADKTWFVRTMESGAFSVGDYQVGQITKKQSLNAGFPVYDEAGRASGVVFAAIDLQWFSRFAAGIKMPYEGAVLSVIDHSGTVLTRYPGSDGWVGRRVDTTPLFQFIKDRHEGGTVRARGLDDTERLHGFISIPSARGIHVVVSAPIGSAFAGPDRHLKEELLWLGMLGFLSLCAAWLGGNRLVLRKMQKLVSAARHLADGDMAARTGLPPGPCELDELAVVFDEMAERLEGQHGALAEAEGRYRALVEQSLAGIYLIGQDYRFLYVNEALASTFGYRPEEVIGRLGPTDLTHPDDRPKVKENVAKRLSGEVKSVRYVLHGLRKDGAVIYCEVFGTLIEYRGQPAILGTLIDITEQMEAQQRTLRINAELEQRVAERTAQLEAANQELESFSYSVSHDLRAPLRAISGFSEALLEDWGDRLDETGRDYLTRVRDASLSLTEVVGDLLSLALVTSDVMHPVKVDLSAMAHLIVEGLSESQPERIVEWIIGEGMVANGDERLLRVALENLMGNAWKFTGGRVKAVIEFGRLEESGETVYFVRDTGAGFDMDRAARLFTPFFRLHEQNEFPGTGIGLATVKRIILRHGGRVWAYGAVDEGATFYFTLPPGGQQK